MAYVFDASFVAGLIIPDERSPITDKMLTSMGEEEILVPQLLWYEMANIFYNLIRRKRYNHDEVRRFFPLLSAIRMKVDFETGADYAQALVRLCDGYNLSSYDAAYLELAKRKRATLCTLDDGLRNAAKKCNVAVMATQ